jgi:DNA-directed RNA polymerase specialized sigma24 family protein
MSAMYLRYFERFSIQELVDSLEVSERSVHRLLSAAKDLLKVRLDRDSS